MFFNRRSKPRPGQFWQWLSENAQRLQSGLQGPDGSSLSREIADAFRASYPDLVWEISPADVPPWTFCVSADGDPDLFAAVLQAVKDAPQVSGWVVRAFRPRSGIAGRIEIEGQTLGPEDVWCAVRPLDDGRIDLVLCIGGLTEETDDVLSRAALILLDDAVGEYDAVTRISELDRAALPTNPTASENFFPLTSLPAFLDRLAPPRSA
jgi:hypothetical protein